MLNLILLAALSLFIIHRLIMVLGKEQGQSRTPEVKPTTDSLEKEVAQAKDADFEVIPPEEASLSDNIKAVFETLRKKDKGFNAKTFIDGASKAFEMIIDAVNHYYVDVLKELLEYKLYKQFVGELSKRHNHGPKYEATLVKIKNIEILDAYIKSEMAYIKVKINSQQIILTKDKEGKIIDGKPDEILDISDIWTFWKKVKEKDYWELMETSSK